MTELKGSVGRGGANLESDVEKVQMLLNDSMPLLKSLPLLRVDGDAGSRTIRAIEAFQATIGRLQRPDGRVDPNGKTLRLLDAHQKNPVNKVGQSLHGRRLLTAKANIKSAKVAPIGKGVQLPGKLREAWDLISPYLPDGSYCSSGYRSADDQRRILHEFFLVKYRKDIIQEYSQKIYDDVRKDLLGNEKKVLAMVKRVGQAVAAPGQSQHQRGKAIDIGGPSALDAKQVDVVERVARAHPNLFSGKILKERNGCVHFEIL